MSYRAAWPSNRMEIIRSASLKYLHARTRFASRVATKKTIRNLNNVFRGHEAFLDVTRTAHEIRAVRHSNWTKISRIARC
eukprot:6406192-Pyramimonas_sp.AAC.1